MARVRGVIARSTATGSRLRVSGIDLREDRRRAHLEHRVGHGDKGKGRHNDFVALAHPQRQQCQMQAGGAGTDSHSVLNAVIRGQLRLERREFRTQAKIRRAQDGGHGRDLGLGDVGRGEWNARGHEGSGCAAFAVCGSGTGCLTSRRSSGTEAKYAGDGLRRGSVTVGICHAGKAHAEGRAQGALKCGADGDSIRRRIDHVACALAALLAHAHVDDRQGKRRGLHDAAGGVADERIDLAKEAPVSHGVEVDEDMRVGARCRQRSSTLDECMASSIGVGVDENDLAGRTGSMRRRRHRLRRWCHAGW